MSFDVVAKKYCAIVMKMALRSKTDTINDVIKDIKNLLECLTLSKKCAMIAMSPAVPFKIKKSVWRIIFDEISVSHTTADFILLLVGNNRVHCLNTIFNMLQDHNFDGVKATFTTSFALNRDVQTSVEADLAECMKKDVRVEYIVDKSILGGCIIRYETFKLDLSIRGKLRNIKMELLS